MSKEFFQKYKDPRWQRKRLAVMERDKFTCKLCKSSEDTLNVHHIRYLKNTDPWDYDVNQLITLCDFCHELTEDNISLMKGTAVMASPLVISEVMNFVQSAIIKSRESDGGVSAFSVLTNAFMLKLLSRCYSGIEPGRVLTQKEIIAKASEILMGSLK